MAFESEHLLTIRKETMESKSRDGSPIKRNSEHNSSVKLTRNASGIRRVTIDHKPKNKFLTTIERKLTRVPHEEFLRQKDVTLEEKRTLKIYTMLNISAFIFQIIAVAVVQFFKDFDTGFW